MADYVKSTNFTSKDALVSGNPLKIVRGAEIDDEFNAIATAVATKANTLSPTFTGTPAAPTAAVGTDTSQVATTAFVQDAIAATLPPGTVIMRAVESAPTGWLLCHGQAVSRTVYADLYNAIGTTYGVGDGSTTFNVPEVRERVPVGAGSVYDAGDTGAFDATSGASDVVPYIALTFLIKT